MDTFGKDSKQGKPSWPAKIFSGYNNVINVKIQNFQLDRYL